MVLMIFRSAYLPAQPLTWQIQHWEAISNERSKNIQALIRLFEDLDMVALQNGDVLGDAYEYLIGQFAMESGKKAGEFYTSPSQRSHGSDCRNQLINFFYLWPNGWVRFPPPDSKKTLVRRQAKSLNYYGQEKNTATYNLTRMNLLLRY